MVDFTYTREYKNKAMTEGEDIDMVFDAKVFTTADKYFTEPLQAVAAKKFMTKA